MLVMSSLCLAVNFHGHCIIYIYYTYDTHIDSQVWQSCHTLTGTEGGRNCNNSASMVDCHICMLIHTC